MRLTLRSVGFLVLVASFVTSAQAGWSDYVNDAGTGRDAGDSLVAATTLAGYGAYHGGFYPSDERDWFVYNQSSSAPRCVEAQVSGELAADAFLTVSGESSATHFAGGASVKMGVAAADAHQVVFGLQQTTGRAAPTYGWGRYDFALAEVAIPASPTNDAGTGSDAPSSLSNAPTVTAGCLGGHLTGVGSGLDLADVYNVGSLSPDQVLTISFAATSTNARLNVVDAAGNVVASLVPGQLVDLSAASGTSYGLSVVRLAGTVDEIGYLVGSVVGPGPTCRPNC